MVESSVAFVTGASSGFGHGVALELCKKGFVVCAAARRTGPMQDLQQAGAGIIELDVTDADAVNAAIAAIIDEHGRLDVVFNNAGLGVYGAVETVPADRALYQFEVNLFGAAHVLRAALPHMRKVDRGRIINVSSVVAHFSGPFMGWYASSKFALRALTDALRMELADTNIKVVMIEPGAVKTGFADVAQAGMEGMEHPQEYRSLLAGMTGFMEKMIKRAPDQDKTVAAMLHAATSANPKPVYKTTLDSRLYSALFGAMPTRMQDLAMSWSISGGRARR